MRDETYPHSGLDKNSVRIYLLIFYNPAYKKMLGWSVAQASIRLKQMFVFWGLSLMKCQWKNILIWLRVLGTLVLILPIGSCFYYEKEGGRVGSICMCSFFLPWLPPKEFSNNLLSIEVLKSWTSCKNQLTGTTGKTFFCFSKAFPSSGAKNIIF